MFLSVIFKLKGLSLVRPEEQALLCSVPGRGKHSRLTGQTAAANGQSTSQALVIKAEGLLCTTPEEHRVSICLLHT